MSNTLIIFSAITTHLVSLTGFNEYGHPKSRGISSYEDLAEELNEQGILTARNTLWSANSLECFLSRCRKKYTKAELHEQCPLDLVGAEHHEFVAKRPKAKSGKIIRFKRSLYNNNYFH
jgi:hypothetical protein